MKVKQFLHNLLNRFSFKKSKEFIGHRAFVSISDLPIEIWYEIHKKGNLQLLLKSSKKINDTILLEVWENIQNEHIARFGINKKLADIILLQKNIALMTARAYAFNELHLLNVAQADQEALEEIMLEKGTELIEVISWIENWKKIFLPLEQLSVERFYTYLEQLKNQNGG